MKKSLIIILSVSLLAAGCGRSNNNPAPSDNLFSYQDKLAACGSLPNGSTQYIKETTRIFVNLPKDIYPVNDPGKLFYTASGTAAALYISNGGPIGAGLQAKPGCWSTYYEFDDQGEIDLKVIGAGPGVPDYIVRFIVGKTG